MFTTSCFIRKNTLKLREALKKLGYFESRFSEKDGDSICTYTGCSAEAPRLIEIKQEIFDNPDPMVSWKANRIDCGDNEELFLALAALRDDTSANQLWVFDQDFPPNYEKGDFVIGGFKRCSCYCHVATVEELIKHFNHE